MKRSLLFSCLIGLSLSSFGQVVSTITNGSVLSPTTWACACVPGSSNDVIIAHEVEANNSVNFNSMVISSGGQFRMFGSGFLVVNGDIDIQAGGTLITERYTVVDGDLTIDGTWAGNQSLELRGTNSLSGTGTISNTATLYFKNGPKTILAGTILDKTAGIIDIRDVTVNNNGSIRASVVTSSGANARWVQGVDSRVEFVSILNGTLQMTADAVGNTVAFTRPSSPQDIWPVQGGVFHNLELSSNLVSWRKNMRQDLVINGDLLMSKCAIETRFDGTDRDIQIVGNWTSDNGILLPKTGQVEFINVADVTISHTGEENFNDLLLNGSGTVTLEGDMLVNNDLTINSPLVMEASDIRTVTVGGDVVNNSTYTANEGKIVMNGSVVQNIDGNMAYYDLEIDNTSGGVNLVSGTHDVHGTLSLTNGEFFTQDRLVMVSNADGDSRIDAVTGGNIVGELTAQRYIDAGATNWRFLTAPAQNRTVGDWTDDFNTSGFIGSTWPSFSFTSVYFHDETAPGTLDDGFVPASNVTDVIGAGQGVWVWCGDSLQGTSPFTIDVQGEPYIGDLDLPVTYTDHGSPANDGWNMVANPYISTIDWDDTDWVKNGINDAIYIWVPELQQFASYVAGVGVNGGSRFIASSQAFWVQTNSASPQLRATEGVKVADAVEFRSNDQSDLLRLAMSRNGLTDQLVIRYFDGATGGFDAGMDAIERISPTSTAPNFHSVSVDGEELMINSIPAVQTDTTIQLSFQVAQGGTYDISVSEIEGRFAASCLILEDQLLGTETALVNGTILSVSLTPGQSEDRFRLRIAGTIEHIAENTSCPGANDGSLIAQATGSGPFTYTWYDDAGNVLRVSAPTAGPDTLSGLYAGRYSVEVVMPTPCAQVTAEMTIEDAPVLVANEVITSTTCPGQSDGSIALNLPGGNSGHDILWSTGDVGGMIDNLEAGQYDVTVDSPGGCVATFSFTVSDGNALQAGFSAPQVAMANQSIIFQNTSIGATDIMWDMGDGTTYSSNSPQHDYAAAGTYTVVMTASNAQCMDVVTHEIVIEDITNSVYEISATGAVSFQQIGNQLYLVNNSNEPRSMTVMINNLLGQNLGLPINRRFDSGQTLLDISSIRGQVIIITAIDHTTGERFGKRFML